LAQIVYGQYTRKLTKDSQHKRIATGQQIIMFMAYGDSRIHSIIGFCWCKGAVKFRRRHHRLVEAWENALFLVFDFNESELLNDLIENLILTYLIKLAAQLHKPANLCCQSLLSILN